MKKILVTGGTGAVGKYIVDDLVQHGDQVGVLQAMVMPFSSPARTTGPVRTAARCWPSFGPR